MDYSQPGILKTLNTIEGLKSFYYFHDKQLVQCGMKVLVDLSQYELTIGQVRRIMNHAIAEMKAHELDEIIIRVTGYSKARDALMASFDCYRYGASGSRYRLVNPEFESSKF